MPTAERGRVSFEVGQTAYAMGALTDSGDHQTFAGSASPWSQWAGYAPVIRPNGLVSGGAITPAISGTNDLVDVAAGTAYIGGVLVTFDADTDVAITRATSTDTHMINSITVTSVGAVAVVTGTDHASAFSETRAADGGPPLIATTSIEIGQVRTDSYTAAPIAADEIFTVDGLHTERSAYPVMATPDYLNGTVTFASALPLIHTGPTAKGVYASFATPILVAAGKAKDFKPAVYSYSVTSEPYYGGAEGSSSKSLNSGSFSAFVDDGITDALSRSADQTVWIKFEPDYYKDPYWMTQGILGIDPSYPADKSISVACTIAASAPSVRVEA